MDIVSSCFDFNLRQIQRVSGTIHAKALWWFSSTKDIRCAVLLITYFTIMLTSMALVVEVVWKFRFYINLSKNVILGYTYDHVRQNSG